MDPRDLLPKLSRRYTPKTDRRSLSCTSGHFIIKEREQLIATLQSLINDEKDKKTSKKLPELTPAVFVSLAFASHYLFCGVINLVILKKPFKIR